MSLLECGSTPAVGSSRMMVFDPAINAMPIESFLFMPPESVLVGLCLLSVNPVSSKNLFEV